MENIKTNLTIELDNLIRIIIYWKSRATVYRFWNIFLFSFFKFFIPIGSLLVAISTYSDVQGIPVLSSTAKLIISGLVVLFASLDSFLGPSTKKRFALKKSNSLRELEIRLKTIKAMDLPIKELSNEIFMANEKLKELLDDYAEKGY
jgi:hypothetical protein